LYLTNPIELIADIESTSPLSCAIRVETMNAVDAMDSFLGCFVYSVDTLDAVMRCGHICR
jgi:hypothetical protein